MRITFRDTHYTLYDTHTEMKFYNREKELALLSKIDDRSKESAQMTFVVGRRRVGKTSLLAKAIENKSALYFFVSKKSEALLCAELLQEITTQLKIEMYGTFTTFKDLFAFLMDLSTQRSFTFIIDEFQELMFINPSIYSDMQHLWDSKKSKSRINLILCGSIYSLMKRIFEHSKEPLFGRANNCIHVKAFQVSTLKEILTDYHPDYTPEDLLAFYMITGGVAKYVELLVNAKAFTLDNVLDEVFSENTLFLDEGKNVLIDEFGKDYGNYFSILTLIASSKTSRVEMQSILGIDIGGFLDRLEIDFGLIQKVRPIFSKPASRSVKYRIQDNFLNFWFRFIYKYRSAIEIGNLNYVKEIVIRDYKTYSGWVLEKYFTEVHKASGKYSDVGNYWETANQNEIDIVAINEIEKRLFIAEVKRNPKNINLFELEQKASKLTTQFKGYQIEYKALSLEEM